MKNTTAFGRAIGIVASWPTQIQAIGEAIKEQEPDFDLESFTQSAIKEWEKKHGTEDDFIPY